MNTKNIKKLLKSYSNDYIEGDKHYSFSIDVIDGSMYFIEYTNINKNGILTASYNRSKLVLMNIII